jgi:hypothetical protein
MLVACRLAGLSALEGTMRTSTRARNAASKSNRRDTVLDRLRCMRCPGESYSDMILRLAKA